MDAQEYESFLSSIQNTALEQATNLTAKGEPVLKITIKHFDTDRIDLFMKQMVIYWLLREIS